MMYQRFRRPSVWREMDELQRELNQVFNSFYPNRLRAASGYPAMNVWANEDSVLITAEVPGVDPKDIEISVLGDTLTLNGVRNPVDLPEDAQYHRRERGYGKFSRTIKLPYLADVKKVDAKFKNGILNITLPRAEADKPLKIAVKSA